MTKLPKEVWSTLGPVPVREVPVVTEDGGKEDKDAFAQFERGKREIQVVTDGVAPPAHIYNLFHEMTHIALWDSGAEHAFTEAAVELICDAVANYMAGAAIHGYLALRVPK